MLSGFMRPLTIIYYHNRTDSEMPQGPKEKQEFIISQNKRCLKMNEDRTEHKNEGHNKKLHN